MDDADLNQNIGDQAEAIDGPHKDDMERQGAIGGDQGYLDPSRWWFASSAFPMVAGTLGPVASAFSICALVKYWRQHIPPGLAVTQAVFVKDPDWLTGINAAQLVIALIANLFLLLNMAKRVRFSIAQPITIVGWYISAICLMALAATASGPLHVEPVIEYVWSQAFYYGIFAAILYFIVASLMTVTVWGARAGHYQKDFELTASQRTLMLQTIMFLIYLLVGALVFSTIEGWDYLDAVYWADVTLFTVGYGDFSPATTLGRALLIPYALIGVISLGLVIGSIRSLILDRGKRRLDARMLEKKRRQLLKHMRRKGKDGVFEPIEGDQPDGARDRNDLSPPRTELERRQTEFDLMRKVQARASTRRRWTAMAISSSTWVVLWLVGAKIFQESEAPYQGWSYFDAFYFCFTGLTTIGYGDLSPVSPSGKAFFVFWSLLALPTMTVLISNAGDTVVKWVKDGTLKLGNLTILPGETGFRREAKQLLGMLSCGALFTDVDIEESPPGFLGAAQPSRDSTDTEESDDEDETDTTDASVDPSPASEKKTDQQQDEKERSKPVEKGTINTTKASKPKKDGSPTSSTDKSKDQNFPPPKRAVSMVRVDIPSELPKSRAEYHLMLIDEIARVTVHLQHSPPRKYTFKEWAWYLRLMGEDESRAETHRKPARRPSGKDRATMNKRGGDGGGSGDVVKWSWVGHRSPLMDSKEEAEWILDRLEQKLRNELQAVVKEQGGKGRVQKVRKEEEDNEVQEEERDPAFMGGD
ncbi:ion channel protein [Xylariales sp. AK1849]|nr:ion channel protein [Xylariales sp. AK1849]